MTTLNYKQDWPFGIISSEFDLLESRVTKLNNGEFERLHADLSGLGHGLEKADYLTLLKIERELVLGHSVDIDDPVYSAFFIRRLQYQRVAVLKVRVLLICNKVPEAKVILSSLEEAGLPKSDCSYLRSRICLEEKDQEGWLNASREVLRFDPTHRDVIYLMGSLELKMSIELDAVGLLKTYLEFEPNDIVMRSLLRQLLIKYGLNSEARDNEEILSFLNSNPERHQ